MRAHSFRTVGQGSCDRTNKLISGQTGNRVEDCLRCLASSPAPFFVLPSPPPGDGDAHILTNSPQIPVH